MALVSCVYVVQLLNQQPDVWADIDPLTTTSLDAAWNAADEYMEAWAETDTANPPPFPRQVRVIERRVTERKVARVPKWMRT